MPLIGILRLSFLRVKLDTIGLPSKTASYYNNHTCS
jgi:hypothetical protein